MDRSNPAGDDDMRPEYDFSAGVRGKHHEQYKAGTNVVFLDADVAKVFKDQRCRIRSEAFADHIYDGFVSRLMPIGDRAKGAVPVRVKVNVPKEEQGQFLKPDMGVIVSFFKDDKKNDKPETKK